MSATYSQYASSVSTKASKQSTPQTQPIPGRENEMALNNAGGFTFVLDQWGVYDRFLMLGSEQAGYYVGKQETTKKGFDTTISCIKADGLRAVARAVEYSIAGRAPKNDPAVLAIALAAVYGDAVTQAAAYEALPKVARTGTWLFLFVSILDSLGKWNAAAKRGVAKWYTAKTVDRLAVQLLKYQQRNGWAHRDVLRLAHVKPSSEIQSNLFRYSVKGADGMTQGMILPQLVIDFELLKRTDNKVEVMKILSANPDISWEMVPTQWLKDKDILSMLVKNMGLTAVIRKLGILTQHGVIAPLSQGTKDIVAKLQDAEQLQKQRVHPITLLQAMKQYSAGRGEKGSAVWVPEQRVIDSLDEAFYASFGTIESTDENYLFVSDISGSMTSATVNGSPNLYAAEVSAVMSMAIARNQPNSSFAGFHHEVTAMHISPKMRLDQALKVMREMHWNGGSTDAAKAYEYAIRHNMPVDKVVVLTDNETYAGGQAPVQALNKLRQKVGRFVKSVVVATSVSEFTIADPTDAGMLDIAGFDSAAPQLIAQL